MSDSTQQFTEVLDENPSLTAVSEVPADIAEFGRVDVLDDVTGGNAIGELASYLAASTAGISLNLKDANASDIGKHVFQASIDNRTHKGRSGSGASMNGIIDPAILAMMNVSEFYTITEGDLWQFALVPLQLGFHQELHLTGDVGAIREARQYLEELDSPSITEQLWLARWVYGNSYPVLNRENPGDPESPIESIYVVNSKHVAIRPQVGIGPRQIAYSPSKDTVKAIMAMSEPPDFIFRPINGEWNEATGRSYPVGFEIKQSDIVHFHTAKLPNHIYALPPLARAMTTIDARRDLDVMNRATIRGFRSQLWVFLLDKAKKGEGKSLRAALGTDSKTGVLVWGSNLKVEQHAPKSLDQLLGSDAQWNQTMRVYRDIGITPRVVAGESPSLRAASGDAETDVAIFLDKLLYDRDPFQRFWQMVLRSRFGDDAPVVSLPDINIAIANRIRDILVPLMNFGVPSPTTAFQMAGLDPVAERKLHEDDWSWREKYMHPYTGFSQAGPSGVTDSPSGGRPAGQTEGGPREPKQNAKGSIESDYKHEIASEWSKLQVQVSDPATDTEGRLAGVKQFMLALLGAGAIFRPQAYTDGYRKAGGIHRPDMERMEEAVAWDVNNSTGLEQELVTRVQGGTDISGLAYRALLYASMGFSFAYMAGVFQARMEQGYTYWVRVLQPLASKSGPCEQCEADAGRLHSINEPFTDHPNGKCQAKFVQFFSGTMENRFPGGIVRIPHFEGRL